MAHLTIRNLTINPIELIEIERFEGQTVRTGNVLSNMTSHISGFIKATDFSSRQTQAKGDPIHKEKASVKVEPFKTKDSGIRAADKNKEVVRLTFKYEDHKYQVDIPSPSNKSSVMKNLDGGKHDLTVVYTPNGAFLAIFSSAQLHRWMHELHDDWPLTLLSIPGTHNSPTCYTALPSVRCQAVDVLEQLKNGVRFLDVRVSVSPDDDELALVHSVFPISLTGTKYFKDMLEDIYKFLDENSSETVIMSIKREGTGKGNDEQLGKYLKHSYVDKRRSRWWTEPKIPTLGGARGRIVIVRRFNLDGEMKKTCWDGRGWGIDAGAWPDNCEDGKVPGGIIRVQDFYEITESQNIEKKIEYCRRQLERAAEQTFALAGMDGHKEGTSLPPLFVNFLTASNFFNATCWPERIAAKVNPSVIEYLCMCHGEDGKGPNKLKIGSAGTGVVVTDWVGHKDDWDLIRCIVGMNARLSHSQMNPAIRQPVPSVWRMLWRIITAIKDLLIPPELNALYFSLRTSLSNTVGLETTQNFTMASLEALLGPMARRLLKVAAAKTTNVVRTKLVFMTRPLQSQLTLRTARVARQPIHPVAVLRQQKRHTRWFSSSAAQNVNRVIRRFVSSEPKAARFDRSKIPTSNTSRRVAQFSGRAPFANALRPNLTGGAFPRSAGGYSLGGSARYFSHTPAAPAQVVQNVSQAMRAFFLSGQKLRYDGLGPRGERQYRAVSPVEDQAMHKLSAFSHSTPGSFIDFQLSPTVTALSPLAAAIPFASETSGFKAEAAAGGASLNTEGFLDVLSSDFGRALQDLTAINADLRRLAVLGDLPVLLEKHNVLRVRFPGVDAETIERLCDDIGIQRGVVGQDADFDNTVGVPVALRFPFAPDGMKSAFTPSVSVRSLEGYETDEISTLDEEYFVQQSYLDEMINSPWLAETEGYETMSPPDSSSIAGPSEDYEGLEGIYRFLEECDQAKGRIGRAN